MADDKIFAKGLFYKNPPEGAPTWLNGKISIFVDDFAQFLEEHAEAGGWMNIDIKESKGGKLYAELNTYKKQGLTNLDE